MKKEIIFPISNHPVYTDFTRKAKLSDLTFNNDPQQILFKLEVENYDTNNVLIIQLTKNVQFIADSESTIVPDISDIDYFMDRILNGDAFLTIISDAVNFLDVSGKLNQKLGL